MHPKGPVRVIKPRKPHAHLVPFALMNTNRGKRSGCFRSVVMHFIQVSVPILQQSDFAMPKVHFTCTRISPLNTSLIHSYHRILAYRLYIAVVDREEWVVPPLQEKCHRGLVPVSQPLNHRGLVPIPHRLNASVRPSPFFFEGGTCMTEISFFQSEDTHHKKNDAPIIGA